LTPAKPVDKISNNFVIQSGDIINEKTPSLIWLLVWLLTQGISLISVTLLFTLGLILIEFLLYPLALCIVALLAGLTAVLASNLLVRDGLQTPVEAIVVRCEATAAHAADYRQQHSGYDSGNHGHLLSPAAPPAASD
jgi:hypothetical protein